MGVPPAARGVAAAVPGVRGVAAVERGGVPAAPPTRDDRLVLLRARYRVIERIEGCEGCEGRSG